MKVPDLEIGLLRTFVAVAESGGFTAAAAIVGRSQSAVSQQVLRLEHLVGQRVFERSSRSLALTATGERLLPAARGMIEANDRLMHALREPAAKGLLRLGISEDFLPGQLPRMLARFARLYPGVEIDLVTGLSRDLIDAYDSGQFDAVIAKKDSPFRRGRVIWREPLVWLAAAHAHAYARAEDGPVPLVMLPKPCFYRDMMTAALGKAGRDWVVGCTTSSLTAAQAAVAGGLGVTALGRSFLRGDMRVLAEAEGWPPLPSVEIMVLGEEQRTAELVHTLVGYLARNLQAQGRHDRQKP